MGWADGHIARLARGETVQFRPRGHSMTGKVNDGQLCTVEPIGSQAIAVGDIVLCRVKGNQYLHLVKAIQGERYQIGNNRGGINGWIRREPRQETARQPRASAPRRASRCRSLSRRGPRRDPHGETSRTSVEA